MWYNTMLVARKASCCVANAFSTGLKLIWPRSSLKSTKMSKKGIFCKKFQGSMGENEVFLGEVSLWVFSLKRSSTAGAVAGPFRILSRKKSTSVNELFYNQFIPLRDKNISIHAHKTGFFKNNFQWAVPSLLNMDVPPLLPGVKWS